MPHVKLKHKASKPGTISPISLVVIAYLVVFYTPLVYCPPFLSFLPTDTAPTYHQQNQSWVHAWKLLTFGLGYPSKYTTLSDHPGKLPALLCLADIWSQKVPLVGIWPRIPSLCFKVVLSWAP